MSWPSSVWHLLGAHSWAVALTLKSWGHIWKVEGWWYQPCPWGPLGIHLSRLRFCLLWASRDVLEESHFLPQFWTLNFPSGTPNDPVTHEERYFFGKLVFISSLHTSQHSIYPTCQVKYAVVSPDFLSLSGTKQAGACAQGSVNQGATGQFYGLCFLLHQPTFLLSLACDPLNSSTLNYLQLWASWVGLCIQNLPTFHILHFKWLKGELHRERVWRLRRSIIDVNCGLDKEAWS